MTKMIIFYGLRNFKLLSIFSLLLLTQCEFRQNRYHLYEKNISKILDIDRYDKIFIVPFEGCGACIVTSVNYFKDNHKKDIGKALIFSSVKDVKKLRNEIGEEFLGSVNIFIDKNNYLGHSKIKSIYPQIIFLHKGKIRDIKMVREL
ncbi:MAG: hypothetical protein SFU27_03290 [Thermonemataceae bacterium]|nr:hypothetical protein [Thermonemataceae bacterium]